MHIKFQIPEGEFVSKTNLLKNKFKKAFQNFGVLF